MPETKVLPIARRGGALRPFRVFAHGGLDAAGVQVACGGHRDDTQPERTLREPHVDRMGYAS